MNWLKSNKVLVGVITVSIIPIICNLWGYDFSSNAISLGSVKSSLIDITKDDQFHALKGALHHALLEWSAVSVAVIAAFISFLHYAKHGDVSVPIIGMAMLCAGFTDAFHTLAATRIIAANAPNTDFIPFTWAFSRVFNVVVMIAGLSISLWLHRKNAILQHDEQLKNSHQRHFKLLLVVAFSFTSLAIVSVILAAASDSLPQTMFINALIKRPYDVLPLALFLFSGSLAWSWYKQAPSPLKLAIVFSIIPEVATQIHMSFGSIQLFDNHFNIAHGLKVFAYLCILSGLIVAMMGKEPLPPAAKNNKKAKQQSKKIFKEVSLSGLLKIGTAKYPQSFIIPAAIFILMLSVTALISTTYYIETEKFFKNEKAEKLHNKSAVLESLIIEFYERLNRDIHFLSETPAIQGIIQSIELNDDVSLKKWKGNLETIFKGILHTDLDYLQIRYIAAANKHTELVDVYRRINIVEAIPESHLDLNINDATIDLVLQTLPGEATYSDVLLKSVIHGREVNLLKVTLPIYNKQSAVVFGILEIDVDFSIFMKHLADNKFKENSFYLANTSNEIIYISKLTSSQKNIENLHVGTMIYELIPKLKNIINNNNNNNNNWYTLSLNRLNQEAESNEINAIYQNISLRPYTSKQVIKMVLSIEHSELDNKLQNLKYKSIMLGFGLSILALTLGVFVSRKIVGPMTQMTRSLEILQYTGSIGPLPVESNDEMGVLAREFHNMLIIKDANNKALNEQKFAMDQHVIVSTTNVKGEITYVNDKFCEISGYTAEELLGKDHRILNSGFHGMVFFKEMYETLNTGNVWESEVCNRAKNGEVYWELTTIVPFINEQGEVISYISMKTDISVNKQNARELSHARDDLSFKVAKLQQANADLDQFAYVASHDLKSPLNGISQLVGWIEEDCKDILPKESIEHLGLLKSRSKRMLSLLNDLLDYSRIGRDEHETESIILKDLVEDVFDLQSHTDDFTCKAPGVKMVLQRIPFEMVMRNLISNAVKHHDKNEGNININLERVNGFYQIKVSDDGPGIPPELHEKALEMFQTLKSRDEVEGSGMGMAMVKKMVEHHGGTMKIDSPGGRGTTIVLTWPTPLVS